MLCIFQVSISQVITFLVYTWIYEIYCDIVLNFRLKDTVKILRSRSDFGIEFES